MSRTGLTTVTATDSQAVNSALLSVLARESAVAILPHPNSARANAVIAAVAPEVPLPTEVGLVATTSGSTGAPKAVLIGFDAIDASITAVNAELGFIPQWHLVIPVQHIAGTMTALRGLSAGSQLHQPTINAADPMQLATYAKSIKDLPGMHSIALVPEHLNRLNVINELQSLRYFHKVIVGAGKIPELIQEKLYEFNIPFVNSYGLTETCGGIVWDGKPLTGVSISLNGIGEVLVQSPMNALGYRNSTENLSIINTHDLGSFENDRLQILGRSDNKVKINGHLVDLSLVVTIAENFTKGEAIALEVNGELHIVITNPQADHSQLRNQLIDRVGSGLKGCRIHYKETLPRTDLGKIDMFSIRLELSGD